MKIMLTLGLIVVLAVLFLTLFRKSPVPLTAPIPKNTVRLAYPARGGGWIEVQRSSAAAPETPEDRAKWLVRELTLPDPDPAVFPPLPETFPVRSVYRDGSLLYLDFSREAVTQLSGGSADEIIAIESLKRTMALNLAELDRLQILIDGQPSRTLGAFGEDAGHIDIEKPIRLRKAVVQ